MQITIPLNATRVVQGVAGTAAGIAAWQLGSTLVRDTYIDDLVGTPTRTADVTDDWIVYQQRQARGESLSKALIGIGALAAAGGGVLAIGTGSMGSVGAGLKVAASGALMAGGVGLIGSSIAATMRYGGSDVQPR